MTTVPVIRDKEKVTVREQAIVTTGPAAAALVASGIGTLVIGLMTTGAVLSEGLSNFLNWWDPAGPLTGKTGVAVIVWLISWIVTHTLWKDRDSDLGKAFTITLILIGLGVLLTFPPVFEAFE
ncbi:MAG TPA: hypothetical protein VF177_22815 [Anaerolineae bacterium]